MASRHDPSAHSCPYSRKTKAQLVEELKRLKRQVCDSSPLAAEHTKSVAKLRENEQLFEVIFNGTIDSIFVIDPDSERIVDANSSACRMLRYSRKDLLKLSISDIHPHEMEKVRQLAKEVFSCGKARSDQLSCYTKSGGHIPVEVMASRVIMQGRPFMLVVARDIGERKRRERELERKSAVLQVILDTMDQGISVFDANLNGMASNAKFLELLEFPPELGVGTPFEEYIRYNAERGEYGSGDIEELVNERVELAKQFKPHVFERVRPDGTVIEIRGNPSADGGFVTTYTDITERKRTEEELKQARHQIELILNSAGEGIYGLDLEGRTTFANPAAAKMVGWEVEELIGKSQHAILHHTKPDGSPYPREECPIYAAIKDGSVHRVDTELFWRKDGTSFPVKYVSTPIRDERGALTGAVVVFSDISERKQAQEQKRQAYERLHDAIESIADGFVLFDADDRVVVWNRRFAELYPELASMLPTKPTAEEMFRERIRFGAVGEFDVPVDDYVRWRMETRQKQGGTPAVHRHTDKRWMRTTERKTSEGGVVAISTEITELKNKEAHLREAKEQAEFANRSKSEFLANMSHELRTPLNAIIGFSEMMHLETFGELGNPRYIQYARDIHESGAHLLSLINDILDLSKIEVGKLELKEREVDVAQVVAPCLRIIEERAKEAGLTLTARLSGELPKLRSDERAVKQIVLNLLSNAVKFTPAGGKVTIHAEIEEDGCFVLSVSDTGIGIDANDIPKAFTPFSQIDGSLSRKHEGSGLGLSLVKSLIEMHGGTIELDSELGKGTIATTRFPAERVLEDPAKTKDNRVKAGAVQ